MNETEMKQLIKATASQAVAEAMSAVNGNSFDIAGCDITCVLKYEENDRNDKKGLSLKDWCKKKNYNNAMIYDCLVNKEFILRANRKKGETSPLEITKLGFIAFNGVDDSKENKTTELISPLITVISNSLYIDDKHHMIDEFISILESCEGFDSERGYNDVIKNKIMLFSRKDLKIMESLDITVKDTKQIENNNETPKD